jgi:hypothetical protein
VASSLPPDHITRARHSCRTAGHPCPRARVQTSANCHAVMPSRTSAVALGVVTSRITAHR